MTMPENPASPAGNEAPAARPLGQPSSMRRARQQLSQEETLGLLASHRATHVVIALNDPELGAPYILPISYVYLPEEGGPLGSVYFHGSLKGRKVDLIGADGRASLCAVAQDEVVQETFSTNYLSVVAQGRLEIVRDDTERRRALRELGHAYSPDLPAQATEDEIDGAFSHTCVMALRIESASGKESKEMARRRREGQGQQEG